MADQINPDHYRFGVLDTDGRPIYEVIKVIEAWNLGFKVGNAIKYLSRAGHKTKDPLEDLKKAYWYITRALCYPENLGKSSTRLPYTLSNVRTAWGLDNSPIGVVLLHISNGDIDWAAETLQKEIERIENELSNKV